MSILTISTADTTSWNHLLEQSYRSLFTSLSLNLQQHKHKYRNIINNNNKNNNEPITTIAEYTSSQLKEALASLASTDESTSVKEECDHFHGFDDSDDSSEDVFKTDHELRMLQTVTARRVLDY